MELVLVKYVYVYTLGRKIKYIFYFELESKVGKTCREDYCKQRSCSSHGNKKAKDKLTWVATVGCPMLFISLMIDEL